MKALNLDMIGQFRYDWSIISDPYRVIRIDRTVIRKFADGARKGRDKRPVKSYKLKPTYKPDQRIMMVDGKIVCHPIMVNSVRELIAKHGTMEMRSGENTAVRGPGYGEPERSHHKKYLGDGLTRLEASSAFKEILEASIANRLAQWMQQPLSHERDADG